MSDTTSPQKLKALVEALDLMNEDEDWIPSSKAWKKIKGMIMSLEETPAAAPQVAVPVSQMGPTPRTGGHVNRLPRGPNPAEVGAIRFPEVPVGEPAVIPDGPAPTSSLSTVDQSSASAVPSTNGELPTNPPSSPGL